MSAYKAVILECDLCVKRFVTKVTTTAGGSHQARTKAALKGWTTTEDNQDYCPNHKGGV